MKFSEIHYKKSIKRMERVMDNTHNSLEWCIEALLSHIDAVKYNYSNPDKSNVKLWLTEDFKQLCWYKENGQFFTSKIDFEDV